MKLLLSSQPTVKKPLRFFLVTFYLILGLWLLCFGGLLAMIFIKPNDGTNLVLGQQLYFGFYRVIVGEPNTAKLAWNSILAGILLFALVCLICANFWNFKNTRYNVFINKTQIMCLYIGIVTSIIVLFLINIFNRPLIEYAQLNLIQNGWNINPLQATYLLNLNYVYDIQILNNLTTGQSFVNIQNGRYMIIWVILIISFAIIIFSTLIILFYNSSTYLSFKFGLES